ncbi:hypothetical protein UFOVP120_31 [uncultured Caudovirales phage]|uniref:Uncharacterized protein n=1 Tax=uncultured Caudovirales phage TaxID=2100421 RepID=A0A6J5L8E1_9CAUD|nr:hypothetical protein UFOVP120_31 [uncultured Caudovirales phage]
MYYVVPKDRSIVKTLEKFETLLEARRFAEDVKGESDQNYDIIRMERVWTTQTLDEAHLASLDIPHMARD